MIYSLQYGAGTMDINLDPSLVRAVLKPKPVRPVDDVTAASLASQRQPLYSPPLSELLAGKHTALIVTVDHTRPSPRQMILPILDACSAAGVQPAIILATGRHRHMTQSEIDAHLGKDIADAIPVLQHDSFDRGIHRHLGTTSRGTEILVNKIIFEHDVIIGVGIIEPSYLLGWSGGRKLLMPGLAYADSIDSNHFSLVRNNARIGMLHGNPLSDDAEEFARNCPFHFITCTISGPNDEPAEVISGDPFKAHEEACRRAGAIYRVKPATAPVIISSAGGSPYDVDLVQGKKAILPGIELVEQGGVVILLAECPEGPGAEKVFIDWLTTKTAEEVYRDVHKRELFSLGAHGANVMARPILERNATVILVTCESMRRRIAGSYVNTASSLEEAWRMAQEKLGPNPPVVICEKSRRLICSQMKD